jgi:hypothetical protein
MIKAIVSYRGFSSTIKSELLDIEEARALAAEHEAHGFRSIRIAEYDMGDNKKLAISALSLYKKMVHADNAVSRAAGRNLKPVQSMQEVRARGRAAAAQQAYRSFCDNNGLPIIW